MSYTEDSANLKKAYDWLAANANKKGTPEFDTVAQTFKALADRVQGSVQTPDPGPKGFTGPKDTSYSSAFKSGIDGPLENMGETAEALGHPTLGATLRGMTDAPQNYEPAKIDTDPGGAHKAWYNPSRYNLNEMPRAAVEQLGQIAGGFATRAGGAAVGAAVGGALGSAVPGIGNLAGAAGGATAGALAGPFLFQYVQTLGPVANARAKAAGRDKPNTSDWVYAHETAGLEGSFNMLIPGGGTVANQLLKRPLAEFATNTLMNVTDQAGRTFRTPGGLNVDPGQAISSGFAGMGAAAIHGGARVAGKGAAALPGAASRVTQDVITRTQYPANEDPRRLRSGIRTGTEMEGEIGGINAAQNGTTPNRNAPARNLQGEYHNRLTDIVEGLYRNGDLTAEERTHFLNRRDGLVNNAGRGTHELQQADYDFIDHTGLTDPDKAGLRDAFRDLNAFTNASRANRNTGPMQRTLGAVAPAVAQLIGHNVTGGFGGWAAGKLAGPAVGGGMTRIGSGIDRFLGLSGPEIMQRLDSRRRVAASRGINPGDSRAFMDDIEQRLAAARQNQTQISQGLAAANAQRERAMRDTLRAQNHPGLPGQWHRGLYDMTGLRPHEVQRGLDELVNRNWISPEERTTFWETPEDLGRNGSKRGYKISEMLDQLAIEGAVTRSPEWVQANQHSPQVAGLTPNTFVRDPQARQAAIDNHHAARDLASQAAPPELAQAANTVFSIVDPAAKSQAVDALLAQHPQHAAYIEQHLRPLTQYGRGQANPAPAGGGSGVRGTTPISSREGAIGAARKPNIFSDEAGSVKLEPDELTGGRLLNLKDEAGKKVGHIVHEYDPDTGDLHINSVEHYDGPQALGPRDVMSMLRQLKEQYPGMKTISGFRATGARWGGASTRAKTDEHGMARMYIGGKRPGILSDESGSVPLDEEKRPGVLRGGGIPRVTKEVEGLLKSEPLPRGGHEMPADFLYKVADWMQQAQHDPHNPEVKRAYTAMANEVEQQFNHLVKTGNVKFETWHGKGEPYRNSGEMLKDVRDNKHLWFYKTDENTFGEKGQDNTGHPLLKETQYKDQHGTPLLVNDLFRVVHDYYGHADHGFMFGEAGEYNAFHAHARMFSKDAIPALAAETLAQNAWVNFGPHLRNAEGKVPGPGEPGYRDRTKRPFSRQIATTVPEGLLRQDPNPAPGFGKDESGSVPLNDATDMREKAKRAIASNAIPLTPEELQISTIPALYTKGQGALGRMDEGQTIFEHATSQDRLHAELHGDMTERTPENKTKIARIQANEVLHALTQENNGAEWYGDNITDAHSTAALTHPEILTDRYMRTAWNYILAVTSNGLEVGKNAILQDKMYRKFKRSGKMPTNMGEGKSKQAMIDAMHTWNDGVKEFGKDGWIDMLSREMSVKDIHNTFGYKVAKELQTEVLPVSAIIGPKIGGGFFQNLQGNWKPLTMDRWWSRMWGRLTGQSLEVTNEEQRAPQKARLRAAIGQDPGILTDHGFDTLDPKNISDEDLMKVAKAIWSRDRNNGFARDDNTGERGEFRLAAKALHEGTIKTREDPGSGAERRFQRETAREAMDMLKRLGIDLHPAQFQALLWFPEKDFFMHQGVDTSPPNDYAKAYREIAKKNGKTDEQIDAAIEARRPGGTRKGRPDVGSVDNVKNASPKKRNDAKGKGVLRQAPQGEEQPLPW